MLNFFNKAQKKLETIFTDKEMMSTPHKKNDDFIHYVSSKFAIWKKDKSLENEVSYFESTFDHTFKEHNYYILNFTNEEIAGWSKQEKILNFKYLNYPSYTLSFILEFALTIKRLDSSSNSPAFIFYDYLKTVSLLLYIVA